MTSLILAQGVDQTVSTGEAVAFWILGPIALFGALGLVFARGAVHSALFLAMTMFSLGVLYIVQQAPFLGFTQIIVYTGAIMMLFLFVLMLVGKESSDSVVEVLRGQRLWGTILGIGIAGLMATALTRAFTNVVPATPPNGGAGGLGRLIFTDFLFPFELTSALLITAALGAMVLAFTEKRGRRTQKELVEARFRGEYERISPKPGPGVFATSHSVTTPALLPDGSVAPESLSAIIESTPTAQLEAERKVVEGTEPHADAHALVGAGESHTGEASASGGAAGNHPASEAHAAGTEEEK
ncbi:NADH-quinone oxidoreductase subunit J [Amycolatopsis sp. K13G38]|uniref:NADH-quinone oxidoreductase subunit J n=2 Tax=Amycolatopsis acididurans TaxID=2724524 RepID=A0ABX1J7F4_9PSEU|nr:NADH-quinone oxidoreductase subunit J [Amycolatopsis acididurans]